MYHDSHISIWVIQIPSITVTSTVPLHELSVQYWVRTTNHDSNTLFVCQVTGPMDHVP